jgi:hypothetical protein
MRREPAANGTQSARDLRACALRFGKHASDPIVDPEDRVGSQRNRNLLSAAIGYAKAAGGEEWTLRERRLLKAVDAALKTMVPIYFEGPASGMSLEEYNDVLWTLIKAACRARGEKVPERLPEDWPAPKVDE